MDTILQGLNHTQSYIDDILVINADNDEHFHSLEEVLVHLRSHKIRVKSSKCTFFQDSVSTWDTRSPMKDSTQLLRR